MKLSIIIPVYNVEAYLRKCVDSVLNQDCEDYEIILVDDGSTDASGAICDEYVAKHNTSDIIHNTCPIRVIHQTNAGLSSARNAGIAIAKGEYIQFVDSDDYLEPKVLYTLVRLMAEKQLDILRFNYQNVNEHQEAFLPYKDAKRDVDYSETVTDGETFLNERLGPGCYVSQFILKRELLNECRFKEGVYFEDTEWTPRLLLKAKRVASTPMIVYNYRWRVGSITLPTDSIKRKKLLDDKIKLLYGFQEQSGLVKDPIWFTWMTSFTAMTILEMLAHLPLSERRPYLKELRSLHIFPLSIIKEKILSHRVKIILANISPLLYCNLMSLRK